MLTSVAEPLSNTYLDSLSRSDLINLLKEHGLKGANKKTSEIIQILTEHVVENACVEKGNLPVEEKVDAPVERVVVEHALESPEHVVENPAEPVIPETPKSKQVKSFLYQHLSFEQVALLEKEQLLDFELLSAMSIADFRALDLPMGVSLKLLLALKAKFPQNDTLREPVPTTVSELHLLVNAMVQMSLAKANHMKPLLAGDRPTSGKSLPFVGTIGTTGTTGIAKPVSKLPHGPNKYANVKSVVGSYIRKPSTTNESVENDAHTVRKPLTGKS